MACCASPRVSATMRRIPLAMPASTRLWGKKDAIVCTRCILQFNRSMNMHEQSAARLACSATLLDCVKRRCSSA
eukprot:36846-Pelagomonas_calceolata.AAC.5